MKTQIPLIVIAVFSIAILLAYDNQEALAQLTFTVTALTTYSGHANNQDNCEYLDSSEVWCSSTSGIKIINPTSRSISTTLYSGVDVDDIACGSTYCYSWHNGDTATANLTQWVIDTHDIQNTTTFTMSGGAVVGQQIDLASAQGAENILLPSSASSCGGAGATNLKGLCIFNGDVGFFNASRFISSSDTGATARLFNIKWSETLNTIAEPTLNNVLVFFQDGAGTKTWRIINLNDADITFANTQTCVSGSLAVLQESALFQVFVYSEKYYVPIDNGATGYYAELPIRSTTCLNTVTYPTTWDVPTSLSTDGEFFYTSSYQGSTLKSAMQVYNTTSASLATYNITGAVAERTSNGWYHSTEGELQIIRGSNLVVFTVQDASGGTQEICYVIQGTGQVFCKTYDLDENGNIILDSVIGGVNPRNITDTSGELFCALGLTDCDNPDITTNGTGMFMLLILLLVSYAFVVYIHHVGHKPIGDIHPMLVLLIGIIDVTIAFFLGWIPDYVFYSVIVLMIGLGGFGLYKMIRGA
jgi:hypothetical protein